MTTNGEPTGSEGSDPGRDEGEVDLTRRFSFLKFESLWSSVRAQFLSGRFHFAGESEGFPRIARSYIRRSGHAEKRGVYVIRHGKEDPGVRSVEAIFYPWSNVVYIGKAGTVLRSAGRGRYGQDGLLERITNPRDAVGAGKSSASAWFERLVDAHGEILVEYACWDQGPGGPGRRPPPTPALIEALLLQAFLNDCKRLPPENRAF